MTFEAKADEEGDAILLKLPPTEALDAVLSTEKWMLRKAKEEVDKLSGGENPGIELAEPLPADKMEEKRHQVHSEMGREPSPPPPERAAKKMCGGGPELDW